MFKWLNQLLCAHQVCEKKRIPNYNNGRVFSLIEIKTCIHCGKVTRKEY